MSREDGNRWVLGLYHGDRGLFSLLKGLSYELEWAFGDTN